jgi:hypothetical protein
MAGLRGTGFLLILAGVALGGDAPRARVPRPADFQERVNAAIDRGVAWLRSAQQADGSYVEYPGYAGATTALAYHTLRVCGVERDDSAAERAWEAARKEYAVEKLRIYSAVLYLLAISSHGDPVAKATDDRDVHLSAADAKWAREIAALIADGQDEQGGFSYCVRKSGKFVASGIGAGVSLSTADFEYDNSNTQYALLGLKCAARCGVPIDRSVWKRSLAHFLTTQEKNGREVPRSAGDPSRPPEPRGATRAAPVVDHARGWEYDFRARGLHPEPYTSMTAGGVSSVVICRSELMGTRDMPAKLDAESERAVWDGLAWLGINWSPRTLKDLRKEAALPEVRGLIGNGLDFYEYFAVERAGVLADVDWMGSLDWYGAGAEVIVAAQEKDGSWTGPGAGAVAAPVASAPVDAPQRAALVKPSPVVEACFALLFLRRGTVPVRRGAVTKSGADDINFPVASKLGDKDLEDFLDLVLSRWRRATDDAVKARLLEGATSVGPRIVQPLLDRMVSADADARAGAHALLRHATGLDFGFVADAKPDVREPALAKWRTWWTESKDRLVYDAATRRLVVR